LKFLETNENFQSAKRVSQIKYHLKTYCAHVKALSSAAKDPPTKGLGGFGSWAIHHPIGILTAFNPFCDMNMKSSSVM
jgi:hypothetical protein